MTSEKILEVPVKGMDCAECVTHVQHAIAALPGVQSVDVFLSSEKAVLRLDPARVSLTDIRAAVAGAGYSVPESAETASTEVMGAGFTRSILSLFGVVFGAILLIVIAGEGLGLFKSITALIPAPLGYVLVLIAGYPTFLNVVRAAMKRQVISHTLMSIGVIAALVVGQWVTAAIVVFFMRVGDYAERFTTERSRQYPDSKLSN